MKPALFATLCALAFSSTGCSMMAAATAEPKFLAELHDDDLEEASHVLDDALGTKEGELPIKQHNFTGLMLAERGTIRLAIGDSKGSIRDLGAADKMLDVKDMSLDDVMRHTAMPSGERHGFHMGWFAAMNYPFIPRLHERLMINPLQMISYLDLGDDSNARVESRRLDVMIDYATRLDPKSPAFKTRALSGILAGFAFEQAGDNDEACRQYRDATATTDNDLSTIVPGGKVPNICSPPALPPPPARTKKKPPPPKITPPTGEILIVIAYGLSPHFRNVSTNPKVPDFELVDGSDSVEEPTIRIDGESIPSVEVLALSDVVVADWEESKVEVGGANALLSWSALPAHFAIARVKASPGHHDVELAVRGANRHQDLMLNASSFVATSLVVLR